jgi:hypothetical protein
VQDDSVYTSVGSHDCAPQLVPAVGLQSKHEGQLYPGARHHSSHRHTQLAAEARPKKQIPWTCTINSSMYQHVAHIARAIQSGASRAFGLQDNEVGGIDFVIRNTCSGNIQVRHMPTCESESQSDMLQSCKDKERGEFKSFFGDAVSLDDVRFNIVPKVTKPARHCPRQEMVHIWRTARQTTPQLVRAGQIDPSVWVRAVDSEPSLIRVSNVVVRMWCMAKVLAQLIQVLYSLTSALPRCSRPAASLCQTTRCS